MPRSVFVGGAALLVLVVVATRPQEHLTFLGEATRRLVNVFDCRRPLMARQRQRVHAISVHRMQNCWPHFMDNKMSIHLRTKAYMA